MFHYINEAWVKILARQLRDKKISEVLCVITNKDEINLVTDIAEEYGVETRIMIIPAVWLGNVELFNEYNINLMNFDDILVSHDLNDMNIKDYLAKHCRRLNKNLE
jgi:hypothetical protein